jgi:hypothetical protein
LIDPGGVKRRVHEAQATSVTAAEGLPAVLVMDVEVSQITVMRPRG